MHDDGQSGEEQCFEDNVHDGDAAQDGEVRARVARGVGARGEAGFDAAEEPEDDGSCEVEGEEVEDDLAGFGGEGVGVVGSGVEGGGGGSAEKPGGEETHYWWRLGRGSVGPGEGYRRFVEG